jgi:GntR family transcriptional regulator of arabinose operon
VQLANEVRRLILGGLWSPSYRIPSEAQLAEEFSISRNTVRLALQVAENEGLIVRQAGKGSFVSGQLGGDRLHRFVGFVVPYSQDLWPARVLLGVQRIAGQRGYHVIFGNSAGHLSEENAILEKLDREGIRNYIVWPASEPGHVRYLQQLAERGYPVVQVDRFLPHVRASFVGADNHAGGVIATNHLIELGHQRVAFLAYRGIDISSVQERYAGYQQAMRDAGLNPLPPVIIPRREEVHLFEFGLGVLDRQVEQIRILAAHLSAPDRPTAIFAMNDLAAYQALKAAERANLYVPDDLAIVGFDNADFCQQLDVPLTSVAQDPVAIGSAACELLIRQIEGLQSEPASLRLPVHLVVRESTVGSVGQ